MSEFINFKSDVANQVSTFDSLPEDRYNVEVEAAEVAPTKAGGQMIKVTFLVADGKHKGRKLWNQFNIGGKSNIFLFNFLKAVNSSLVDQDGVTPQLIAGSLKGAKCSVYVEPDKTQNGNPTNKLSKFAAVTGAAGMMSAPASTPAPKKPLFG